MYSFPSRRTWAFSFAAAMLPAASRSLHLHDFGANETLFDVAVNFSRGFHGGGTFADRPRANFGFARGEKWHQSHQIVGRADQAVEPGSFNP